MTTAIQPQKETKKRVTKQRTPDAGTREILIEAYLVLCSRIGAGNVTIDKIAQESGFSFGTVRYHFAGDQADITQSAIGHVLQNAVKFCTAEIAEAKTRAGYDPLEAYARANFKWLRVHPAHARFLLYFYYLCSTQVQLVTENQQFLNAARARIEDLALEGIGRGIYPIGRATRELATQVHNIVTGGCLIEMVEGLPGAKSMHEQRACDAIRFTVRNLLKDQ